MRAPRLVLLAAFAACTCVIASANAEEEGGRDTVLLREGRSMEVLMESEAFDKITYRTAANAQPSQRRTREILRIEYAGMAGGDWKAASGLRAAGRFAEAAERFAAVAGGEAEWQKVYGGLAAGDCLELAGKPAEAAKAFATVAETFPKHRLAVDAGYRLGMALALAGKVAEAGKAADALVAAGKALNASAPEYRAFAVRAAAYAKSKGKGLDKDFDQLARKAMLRPADDGDVWYHFNLWLLNAYLEGKRGRDAARLADGMLPALAGDMQRTAQVQFLKGTALIDEDPQGAIVELLKLDCLPYGPEAQVCEARWQAGRLLVEQAKALREEKKPEIAAELEATARVVLKAAAAASIDSPLKAKARELLKALEPKPAEKPAAKPATAAASKPDDKAAKPATGAAAKPDAKPAAKPAATGAAAKKP